MHQLLIPAFCILQSISAQAQCFFPNATALNTSNIGGSVVDEYVPCNAEGTPESMCCRTNTTESPDTCRPDGLCESFGGGGVSRDSCTDALWKSDYCVALCISGTGRHNFDMGLLRYIKLFVHGTTLTMEWQTFQGIRGDRGMRRLRCVMMEVIAAETMCPG